MSKIFSTGEIGRIAAGIGKRIIVVSLQLNASTFYAKQYNVTTTLAYYYNGTLLWRHNLLHKQIPTNVWSLKPAY